MLISSFKMALCPIRKEHSQLTDTQKEKQKKWGETRFLFHSISFPPFSLVPPKHTAMTYLDGLDTFLVGGSPCAGDCRAPHFLHIPLEFGAFCQLCFWYGTPPNIFPRRGQTQSWERETKELGLEHCPRETPPHPLTGFSRLFRLSAPPLSPSLSAKVRPLSSSADVLMV